jgi:hypothetical protein
MRRIVISSASATARSTILIFWSGLTLWPPKESPARAGLSLLGDVVGGPLPTCRGVPQPTSPNLRIRVSLIRQLSAWTLCFERPPRHSRATTRPCSRAFLLRCMSQLMAQSGHSRDTSCLSAFGVKRTSASDCLPITIYEYTPSVAPLEMTRPMRLPGGFRSYPCRSAGRDASASLPSGA